MVHNMAYARHEPCDACFQQSEKQYFIANRVKRAKTAQHAEHEMGCTKRRSTHDRSLFK